MDPQHSCIICTREYSQNDMNYMSALRINLEGYTCDECADILDSTIKAISCARTDGNHYTVDYWREDPTRLDHALTHIFKHKRNDTSEDHLAHAICDLVMEYAK